MSLRSFVAGIGATAILALSALPAQAGFFDPDPGFGGGDGVVKVSDYCSAALVEAAGDRIYVAGYCQGGGSGEYYSWIKVLDASGAPLAEREFRAWCWGFWPGLTELVALPDGDILVGGFADSSSIPGRVWLGRFTDQLEPVKSWGLMEQTCDGTYSAPGFRALDDVDFTGLGGVLLDTHQRIIVVGQLGGDVGAVRLGLDGTVDAAFGNEGVARMRTPGVGDYVRDAALTEDGAILAAGEMVRSPYGDIASYVAAFTPGGAADTSWSSDGLRVLPSGWRNGFDQAQRVQALPTGEVIVGLVDAAQGSRAERVGVTRLQSDGSTDASFAGEGTTTTKCRGSRWADSFDDLLVVPRTSGGYRVQIAIECRVDREWTPEVAAWLEDGTPAPSLGADGIAVVPWGRGILDMALASDGATLGVTSHPKVSGHAALVKLGPWPYPTS